MTTLLKKYSFRTSNVVSYIYDKMILHMTEKWYRSVLERLEPNTTLLDVGIGTAGALIRCKDILIAKNICVIGIDYNPYYVESAQDSVIKEGLKDYISVHQLDIYDKEKVCALFATKNGGNEMKKVDAVYFSGSFSLLPDPKGALTSLIPIISTTASNKGKIYITQTYQNHTPPFATTVKPLIKYITTIDFGQLIKVEEVEQTLKSMDGMDLVEHGIIEGSVDNYYQSAYLSILEVHSS